METRHVRYVWHAGPRNTPPPATIATWIERHSHAEAAPAVALLDGDGVDDPGILPASIDAFAVVAGRLTDGALGVAMRSAADDLVTLDVDDGVWQRRLVALADLAVLRRATRHRRDAARDFFNDEPRHADDPSRRPAVLFVGAPGPHKLTLIDALLGWSVSAYAETVAHARTHLEVGTYAAVILTDALDAESLQLTLTLLKGVDGPGAPSFVVVRSADAPFTIAEAFAAGATEVVDASDAKELIQRRLARTMHEATLRYDLREEHAFARGVEPISGRLAHGAFHAFLQSTLNVRGMAHRGAVVAVTLECLDTVNREAGYAAGDRALRAVGDGLRRQVRADDIVGRLGGACFGVWFSDVDDVDLPVLGCRLQAAVRHAWLGDGGPGLGARVGCARPEEGDNARSLTRRAREQARRGLLRAVS